eukprot:1150735-Pelagomonas_calceolata.AAC.1
MAAVCCHGCATMCLTPVGSWLYVLQPLAPASAGFQKSHFQNHKWWFQPGGSTAQSAGLFQTHKSVQGLLVVQRKLNQFGLKQQPVSQSLGPEAGAREQCLADIHAYQLTVCGCRCIPIVTIRA